MCRDHRSPPGKLPKVIVIGQLEKDRLIQIDQQRDRLRESVARGRNNRIGTTKTRGSRFLRKGCLDFVDGVREVGHLGVELSHQTFQPVDAVEDLDTLRMRIESDLEWSAHGGHLERTKIICYIIPPVLANRHIRFTQ